MGIDLEWRFSVEARTGLALYKCRRASYADENLFFRSATVLRAREPTLKGPFSSVILKHYSLSFAHSVVDRQGL